MSVLTRDAILAELDSGRLRIEPFERTQVGAASIDLHLGDEVRALRASGNATRPDAPANQGLNAYPRPIAA